MSEQESEFDCFIISVQKSIVDNGQDYVVATSEASRQLVFWIHYVRASLSRGVCDRLLDSAISSLKEVAGCLSLGLVRPALFSMRTQMELSISWLYFNDHPIEWSYVERHPDDYPLRGVNLKYIRTYSKKFEERFSLLAKCKLRSVADPYGLLSAYVHGTSVNAAPETGDLKLVVKPKADLDQGVALLAAVCEYVSDVFACWFADNWHDWPVEIRASISSRLTEIQLKNFCEA